MPTFWVDPHEQQSGIFPSGIDIFVIEPEAGKTEVEIEFHMAEIVWLKVSVLTHFQPRLKDTLMQISTTLFSTDLSPSWNYSSQCCYLTLPDLHLCMFSQLSSTAVGSWHYSMGERCLCTVSHAFVASVLQMSSTAYCPMSENNCTKYLFIDLVV